MLPAHYQTVSSSSPASWLEDVMASTSPSASSLNDVSQQNWDRNFQLYFNGIL